MNYEIIDHEIVTKKRVTAPGIVEAMHEYLPWPTLHLDIRYFPTQGYADVVDNSTEFMYRINIL